jgi:sterol desaturase/sphingolipid hydroxylase (fatty acid hydroxylase superfamily)
MIRNLASLPADAVRLIVFLGLLMAIFVPLERLCGLRRQGVFRRAFSADLVYYFLSGLLPKLVLVIPLSATAWLLHRIMPDGPYTMVAGLPLWLRLCAAQVVGELGAYWGHRAMHQVPALWRFHAIHHQAEDLDWLVNTRAHPVDTAITKLCTLVPMYVLGLAQPLGNGVDAVPVLVVIIGSMWGFFVHANLKWRFGWFEWLLSTPGFHHWHHTREAQHVNRNFAPMLPWVDWLFGTLYLPREWPAAYGTDADVSAHLAEQLLDPFGPEETREPSPATTNR